MYRKPFFIFKIFIASFILTVASLYLADGNIHVSFIVVLPQLPFVALISYYEFKHKSSIFSFPVILSSPAVSSHIGTLFGVFAAIKELNVTSSDSDIVGAAIGNSIAGFLTMAFIGLTAGLLIHFTQPPNK